MLNSRNNWGLALHHFLHVKKEYGGRVSSKSTWNLVRNLNKKQLSALYSIFRENLFKMHIRDVWPETQKQYTSLIHEFATLLQQVHIFLFLSICIYLHHIQRTGEFQKFRTWSREVQPPCYSGHCRVTRLQ